MSFADKGKKSLRPGGGFSLSDFRRRIGNLNGIEPEACYLSLILLAYRLICPVPMRCLGLVLVGMGLFTSPLLGQVPQAGLPNGLQLTFDRQNNFTYSTRFDWRQHWERGRYELDAYLHHDHLINTSRQDQPFVQLFVSGYLWQHWNLNRHWAIASWLETDQFWNTNTQRHSLYLGLRYRPLPGLEITPLMGYSWDFRQKMLDQGPSPALRVISQQDFGDGLLMQTRALLRLKYINPRHQRNLHLASEWTKTFASQTGISLTLLGGSNQMDDYQSQSIERIKSDTLGSTLSWQYPLLKGVFWQAQGQFLRTQRRFDYDSFGRPTPEFSDLSFVQVDFGTRQEISAARGDWTGRFTYEFQYLDRGYALENSLALPTVQYQRLLVKEREKDFFRRLSAFDLAIDYRPNPRHRLTLTANNRYLQHDTPSEVNFDDHDELSYGAALEWQADWARRFMTRYRVIGSQRQYAFLLARRSQDNYTQHNLRAEASFRWDILDRLTFRGEQAVYVNYNVKDFEDLNRTNRSTRNLQTRLELRYRPLRRLDIEVDFSRRETHVSYLNWEAFSETTLDTTVFYNASGLARLGLNQGRRYRWQGEAGYRHFSQLRYLNTAMISLENLLTPINLAILVHQTGPTTGLRLLMRGGGSLEASVWWQWQIQAYRYEEIPEFFTLSSNYQESLLRTREVNLRPFLHLALNLRLGR